MTVKLDCLVEIRLMALIVQAIKIRAKERFVFNSKQS